MGLHRRVFQHLATYALRRTDASSTIRSFLDRHPRVATELGIGDQSHLLDGLRSLPDHKRRNLIGLALRLGTPDDVHEWLASNSSLVERHLEAIMDATLDSAITMYLQNAIPGTHIRRDGDGTTTYIFHRDRPISTFFVGHHEGTAPHIGRGGAMIFPRVTDGYTVTVVEKEHPRDTEYHLGNITEFLLLSQDAEVSVPPADRLLYIPRIVTDLNLLTKELPRSARPYSPPARR